VQRFALQKVERAGVIRHERTQAGGHEGDNFIQAQAVAQRLAELEKSLRFVLREFNLLSGRKRLRLLLGREEGVRDLRQSRFRERCRGSPQFQC
jgi:hypothetical protein